MQQQKQKYNNSYVHFGILRFHNTVRKPALLYGSEWRILGKGVEERIEAIQMRFIRPLVGVARRDHIRQQLKVENVIIKTKNYRQKQKILLERIPQKRLPKAAAQYKPELRRDCGKPTKSFRNGEISSQTLEKKKKNNSSNAPV